MSRTRVVIAVHQGNYSAALRTYQQSDNDRSMLEDFARTLLLQDARSKDPERVREAFVELALLGTRGRDLLETLAESAEPKRVQAQALEQLQRLGDDEASERLRMLLADADPEVVDRAHLGLDADRDWPRLREALHAPRASRRLIVLQLLTRAAAAAARLETIAEVSRLDPDPRVRGAALRVLERYGSAAWPALEQALRDSDAAVSSTALEAAAHAALESALPALDQQLGAATSVASLTAAVALLRLSPPRYATRAEAALQAGLSAAEPTLRGRAAVLLASVPDATRPLAAIRDRLRIENVPEVQLALGTLLGARDAQARAVLVSLTKGSSVLAANAAGMLAQAGDDAARKRLLDLRSADSPLARATAARILGRDLHQPELVAQLLADREPSVRSAAAAAVLFGLAP